ncbi:DUF294 nucleotidyltransferase-like domain-containing protein [Paenibacillus segetis]|uniref:CBS domain-containing protein n=1 Tax=Paenibacillus segetis TaxID=1325360 RepID=A0ABQ1Y8U8_9BACL|nr:DUF294 nucleotidyltransferase-like domain-containing protein [Paenibacillus segetis]GGH15910.1 hypothetical protein GCM10008013_10410 [Paenibacillus segetis]
MSNGIDRDIVKFTSISSASSPELLKMARIKEQAAIYDSLATLSIGKWNQIVCGMHDEIMTRAVTLCEEALIQEGFGPPPTSYAFVTFGSAGRGEQTLWSDQDNGLIIGESSTSEEEEITFYFEQFGLRLSSILEEVGYPLCPGNVMISNPLWRKNLRDWERQLWFWSGLRGWEQVRYLMIAADLRHVTGDQVLTITLRASITRVMEQNGDSDNDLCAAVLRNTVRHKAALNVLGQVITEQSGQYTGDFDVKYGLYIPIVNAIRYLALHYGVESPSTYDRISQLEQLEAVPVRELDSCRKALDTAIRLRSLMSGVDEKGMLTGNNYLPQTLIRQKEVRLELREALSTVRLMYRTLQRQHRYAERNWL